MDEAGKLNIIRKSPEIILIFTISSSIVASLSFTIGVNRSIIWLLSAVAVFMILYGIIMINRTSLIITAAVVLFAALVTLLSNALRNAVVKLYSELPEFITWVMDFSNGIAEYNDKYANTLIILIISFTVFLTMLFTLKFFNFFLVLSAGMALFVVQYINDFLILDACFYIFITSMIVYYILRVHRNFSERKPNEYASRLKVFLWSVPISLVIIIASIALPYNSSPIEWDWMDRKFERFIDFWDSINKSPVSFEYFSTASSGFGDGSGLLGGKVKADDTIVLSVESKYPLYLKGIAASQYSNNRWLDMKSFNKDATGIDVILQDADELREGLRLLTGDGELPPGIIQQNTMSVSFENLRTKSLFIPPKLTSIDLGRYEIDLRCSPHGALSADIALSKGFNYKLDYIHIDYNDPEMVKLLRKSFIGLYRIEMFKRLFQSYNDKSVGEPSLDSLSPLRSIAEQNYEDYLQIPEDFPERVGLLARSITMKYNNNYDKVKAIEEYLSNNYSYTLEPPPVPQNRDFVDFFLFNGREGYCTYFATAMTMMLRTIGIPARYVEGYVIPSEPVDDKSERYIVTNRNAHAWPEVYFEGVGWIAFEPTSSFTSAFYSTQAIPDSQGTGVPGDPYYDEILDELDLDENIFDLDYSAFPVNKGKPQNNYLLLIIILSLSVCLVLLLAAFNIIKLKVSLYRIKNFEPGKAILRLFSHYFKLLALAGYRLTQGETVTEYARRLENYILLPEPGENSENSLSNGHIRIENIEANKKSEIVKLFDVFIGARYSKHAMTEKDKAYALAFLPFLTDEIKKEGKLRFLFLRFIRGSV